MAALVVAQAESQLTISPPGIVTSPPRGGIQLAGVPVWFWAPGIRPISTTATIPGLSATLTATPGPLTITTMGAPAYARKDNGTRLCPDGGTPYDPDRHGPWSSSTCSWTYNWNHPAEVTAAISWHLTWTATNGQSGTLPNVTRTSTFTLTIQQAQAVTD